MDPFEFAIAITALVLIFNVVKIAMRQKLVRRLDHTVNTESLERLLQFEERVRVLERIVTDERFDRNDQSKDLGD